MSAIPWGPSAGVAATGIQKIRIEVYGDDDDDGERVLLYIDDVLVATSTDMPTEAVASRLYLYLANGAAVGSAAKNVYVSPLTLTLERIG